MNFFPVQQILIMMVDLEEDAEWTVSDDADDEDSDRYILYTCSEESTLRYSNPKLKEGENYSDFSNLSTPNIFDSCRWETYLTYMYLNC